MSNENKQDPDNKEEFSFLVEKIKEKPINKKKAAIKVGSTLILGVLFGFAAVCAFMFFRPFAEDKFPNEETPIVSIPKDDEEEESEEQEEDEQQPEQETIIEKVGLELDDYKELYSKLNYVAAKASESIVTVTTVTTTVDWYNDPYESLGQASGLIIASNNQEVLILTENHILSGAERIRVTFSDGTLHEAAVKKQEANRGLAVLSVETAVLAESTLENLHVAELGNSNTLKKGTPVIAVGSPLGYADSVGHGIITTVTSTSTMSTSTLYDADLKLFMTNILGSTSGSGVLINLDGEVIGLISQEYNSVSIDNVVMAYAISNLKSVIEMMSNGEEIPYIGIAGTDITEMLAEELDMPEGIFVTEVAMNESPAMNTGIQSGDIIVGVGKEEITSLAELEQILLESRVDQVIILKVMRNGKDEYVRMEFNVTLGAY